MIGDQVDQLAEVGVEQARELFHALWSAVREALELDKKLRVERSAGSDIIDRLTIDA